MPQKFLNQLAVSQNIFTMLKIWAQAVLTSSFTSFVLEFLFQVFRKVSQRSFPCFSIHFVFHGCTIHWLWGSKLIYPIKQTVHQRSSNQDTISYKLHNSSSRKKEANRLIRFWDYLVASIYKIHIRMILTSCNWHLKMGYLYGHKMR